MGILSRDQILAAVAAKALPRETLTVPELGGEVIVRGLSGRERDAFERSLVRGRGKRSNVDTDNVRARLVVRCLVNEANELLFTEDDAEALGNMPSAVLAPIYDAAQRLNGMSDEDIDELKKASGSEVGSGSPSS